MATIRRAQLLTVILTVTVVITFYSNNSYSLTSGSSDTSQNPAVTKIWMSEFECVIRVHDQSVAVSKITSSYVQRLGLPTPSLTYRQIEAV